MADVPVSQPGEEAADSALSEIMALIETGSDDLRLRWSPDRMTVRVVLSRLVLRGEPKLAAGGRRAPFGDAWQAAMTERGWVPTAQPGTFTRPRHKP